MRSVFQILLLTAYYLLVNCSLKNYYMKTAKNLLDTTECTKKEHKSGTV